MNLPVPLLIATVDMIPPEVRRGTNGEVYIIRINDTTPAQPCGVSLSTMHQWVAPTQECAPEL